MSEIPQPKVPPRVKGGTRTGFTTGACSAAAAKAAARMLVQEVALERIETTLPNGQKVTFALEQVSGPSGLAVASIIKDGGDDPDCTHGAEIIATVELRRHAGIEIVGGEGVATVTKGGLGIDVGTPSITPIPRRNVIEMVAEELAGSSWAGARVRIDVPDGEERAKRTLNARLGLFGGISILGTSGIVRPYSTSAFRASVVQAIDVAKELGCEQIVLTTGGKSELYAMRLFPNLDDVGFIQMGDFVGTALRHATKAGVQRAVIVGMIGKLSKMAAGKMQTHAAGSAVSMELLADLASRVGGMPGLAGAIREANTARHVLELCQAEGLAAFPGAVCREVVDHGCRHAGGRLEVHAHLVDFDGTWLGAAPEGARPAMEPRGGPK